MLGELYDQRSDDEAQRGVLRLFLEHYRIDRRLEPAALLHRVAEAFSRLPYENLTKIIRLEDAGSPPGARRRPVEVIDDHRRLGTGGTCFSLTSALLSIVRGLGWPAQPILADRRYGADTHCALLVSIEGRPHLLDPGYLILRPVPIDDRREVMIPTGFNRVVLVPRDGGEKIDLLTEQGTGLMSKRTYRLTFKTAPVDHGEFLRVWDASFDWDMMRYPLLTRVAGGQQVYLQGRKLQHRSLAGLERHEIAWDDLPERIAREFCIAREIIERALTLLDRKGERDGRAPAP